MAPGATRSCRNPVLPSHSPGTPPHGWLTTQGPPGSLWVFLFLGSLPGATGPLHRLLSLLAITPCSSSGCFLVLSRSTAPFLSSPWHLALFVNVFMPHPGMHYWLPGMMLQGTGTGPMLVPVTASRVLPRTWHAVDLPPISVQQIPKSLHLKPNLQVHPKF